MTNQERVGKGLELLREGLAPYIAREVEEAERKGTFNPETVGRYAEAPPLKNKPIAGWDAAALLKLMWDAWNVVFRQTLGHTERSLISELLDWRNRWAHQNPFSSDDADRALDSMERLLTSVSAPQADEVKRLKMELRRLVFQEQVRNEKRKAGGSLVEAAANGSVLKPWREVVAPHPDVASGRYQQAEFAADLWQVYLGEGGDEYQNPTEFFRRTFLTRSLKQLLAGAVQRLSGTGGDPVVQLQTNFGGGKTHSMLALYHLFSGVAPAGLAGVEELMANAGVTELPRARRVVLVGNKISPGNPVRKPDGTLVRTLWGELAWQLGGAEAYARIAADDAHATNPGDRLRELFRDYGPCLILIDEWVAYARQLHDTANLPGGSFETQFTFAQALTESAKLAGNCLLVISLPASDTQVEDAEVGGLRGREALDRLRNVVGRVESSWRPASAEEGFKIVRRRLFNPLSGPEAFTQRDLTARAFADLYRAHASEFPPECKASAYEQRLQAAYPIHPEVFDRLYEDWSTQNKFQRTRGVLRLMAAVIHSLWEQGDRSPLILPSTIPMDDPRVQFELTRYLSDNWTPVIEKDVDGPAALPVKMDGELPNLGQFSATRRVARTIYLGSAPTAGAAHRGIEDRRIRLGCVMPGESPAVFGDALRRLAATATYLYQEGARFWYDTQPTVTRIAEDRAEQLRRDPDAVAAELEMRIRANVGKMDGFARVHPCPRTGADVPDDFHVGLVILPPEQPYSKEAGNAAETAARTILESRGNHPRRYRNTLAFLAADKVRLPDLEDALRRFLAWRSILDEKETLNLDPHQVRQAETQLKAANVTVDARLPETWQWLLVPEQPTPQAAVTWQALRLTGNGSLTARASRKLKGDDLLVERLGGTVLHRHLNTVPLWRGNHVPVRQLVDDFASYLYLPRLTGPEVLTRAISDGVGLRNWELETYAYAESYDEAAGRYCGLRGGQMVQITPEDSGLVVKAEAARQQLAAEVAPGLPVNGGGVSGEVPSGPDTGPDTGPDAGLDAGNRASDSPPPRSLPRRYHGTARLDPTRVGRDAGRIAEEVIVHLAGQPDAEVSVVLEIQVRLPNGADEHTVRTVLENSRTLKFENYNFKSE